MERAVTILTIAEKSGFHYSTVSLALRGDPRIKAATRQTISRVAEELGYQPDPRLKSLSVYRQSIKPEHYHATLAWLSNETRLRTTQPDYIFKHYLQGAIERGNQLGYRIEEFAMRQPGMSLERLVNILKARGIDGLLVAPQPGPNAYRRIRMDWSQFHAVTFGYSLAWPRLHTVSADHSGSARLAVRKLYSLGYRRIGLAVDHVMIGRVNGNWMGGYVANIMARGLEPLVFLRRGSGSAQQLLTEADAPALLEWIRRERLDAVIFDYGPPFLEWLRRDCGIRVPEELGVVSLNVPRQAPAEITGIDQNETVMGWTAMDTLANMINTHERGIPAIPHKLLIDGTWRPGQTIRRLSVGRA